MRHWYQKPHKTIAEYVKSVLVLDGFSSFRSSDLPLFTNGMPALLYSTEKKSNEITLFGHSVPDEKWTVVSNTIIIAFFFKPFVTGTIFKISARQLKENPVELSRWNAQKTMALRLQLLHSKSVKEKIEILNHFILTQIQANQRDCKIIRYATDKLMRNPDAEALSQILRELHVTERTFQRIFKKYVGITPNHYRRISQFYFAFSQLKGGHFDRQAEVAFSNGYFDQSHYIRSFKEFTDTTPNEYLQSGLAGKKK